MQVATTNSQLCLDGIDCISAHLIAGQITTTAARPKITLPAAPFEKIAATALLSKASTARPPNHRNPPSFVILYGLCQRAPFENALRDAEASQDTERPTTSG